MKCPKWALEERHGRPTDGGQVGAAVAVEVPRHEGNRAIPTAYPPLVLEGAVAVAQQHRHVVGAVVGDGQVGAAVAVEVPRHEGAWTSPPPRSVTWSWKVPSPLPSSTDTSLESSVGDGQVGAAVAVEVPRHEGVWLGPRRVRAPGPGRCRRRCPAAPTRRWSRSWRRPGRGGRRR